MDLFLRGFGITDLDSMIIYETKAVGTHYTDIVTLSKRLPLKMHGNNSLEKMIKDLMHSSRGFLSPVSKKDELCFHCTQDGGLVYRKMKDKGYNYLMEHYEDYKRYFSVQRVPYNPFRFKPDQYITSKKRGETISVRVNQIEATDNKIMEKEDVITYESLIGITIEGCPNCGEWINTSYHLTVENRWVMPFLVKCPSCEHVFHLYRYLYSYT